MRLISRKFIQKVASGVELILSAFLTIVIIVLILKFIGQSYTNIWDKNLELEYYLEYAVALLKELDSESGIGLIEKKNMGIAKASVFYVMNFVCEDEAIEGEVCFESVDEESIDVDNFASRVQKMNSEESCEFKNQTHACSENELDCVQNLNPNKNNINKTNMNKTILSINHNQEAIDEMKGYSEIIKVVLGYNYGHEMLNNLYLIKRSSTQWLKIKNLIHQNLSSRLLICTAKLAKA